MANTRDPLKSTFQRSAFQPLWTFFILCTICFSKMLLLLPPLSSDKTIKIRNRTFCRSFLVPRFCAAVNWSCKKYIIQYVIWWILAIDYIIYHTINHTIQNYAAVHFPVSVLSVPVWIYVFISAHTFSTKATSDQDDDRDDHEDGVSTEYLRNEYL